MMPQDHQSSFCEINEFNNTFAGAVARVVSEIGAFTIPAPDYDDYVYFIIHPDRVPSLN